MAIGEIIILSAVLFARTLSAPSGCIESCDFYQTSYQSRQTSGGYQDHAGLVQGSTNLNEHDYARPGNWTERNQYNTDGGHGKVHEERGQYVEGSKRVRYYKKNFTSSYGNVGANVDGITELGGQRRYDSLHIPSNQHLESQATQSGQTVTKESGYSRVHSQQSSTRIDGKSARLEDFGEYGGHSQQHGVNVQTVETTPENWSRVDSYRTDGGNGRVFEEEGQYVTGPKKVRYYKKNYTSSYSTSGDAGSATTLDKLHSELQRNVHEELDKFRREFHQQTASTAGLTQEAVHSSFHGNDLQTAESENTYGHQQLSGYRRVPSTGTVRHYTDQQHTETFADTERQRPLYPTANTYGTESQRTYQSHETQVSRARPAAPGHLSPSYPIPVTGGNYQTGSYSHSGGHHVDEIQRAEVSGAYQSGVAQNRLLTERVYNPNPNYGVYPGRRDESRHYQEERWQSSSSHGGNVAPERSADLTLHGIGGRTHYDRDAYNEQRGRYHSSTAQGYDSHVGSSYSSAYGTSSGQKLLAAGSSLDLGRAAHGADCTEETHQQYQQESSYHRKYKRDDHRARQDQEFAEPDSEKLDLTNASNQQSEDFTQHDEEFGQQQQTEGQLEFGQQTVDDQHLNDFTQQSEQFAQQMQGSDHLAQQQSDKLNFGQQIVGDQHLEDLTQQNEQFTQATEGQLEFGQQTSNDQHLTQHNEQSMQQDYDDLMQQTSGKLEFGQQTVGNQHLEDLKQQTEQFEQTFSDQDLTQHNEQFMQQESNDHTQQTSKLEFGQQIVGNQRLEDLTQQNKQFTQETEGQLEFGQQTSNDQHLTQHNEQSMQQDYDDLMQQTSGKLESGQQTVGNQHLEDLKQQTEQFEQTFSDQDLTQHNEQFMQQESNDHTQQTSKLEFGQQIVGNQRLEDLTQQNKQFTQETEGQLEFGQQTSNDQHLTQHNEQSMQQDYDDLMQQTSGKLEFGQQTVGNQHLEDLKQQTEQFETAGSDDYTQQAVDKLEFGQQTDDNTQQLTQQTEHFTQRTARSEDLTQQTSSKLEFGQQTVDDQHLGDSSQQTIGKLQLQSMNKPGNQKNQHLEEFNSEDFSQQAGGHNDFTQQTVGQLEFGQHGSSNPKIGHNSQDFTQNEDLTQQIGGFDDFTQQGRLEYERREQSQKPNWPGYNTQHSKQVSQQDDWNRDDLSQQSRRYPSYDNNDNSKQQSEWQLDMSQKTEQDFTQQPDDDRQFARKPAPKPKPRQRYQKQDSIPSHTDGTEMNLDDIFEPIKVNPEADMSNLQGRTVQHSSRLTHPGSDHRSDIPYAQNQRSVFDNEKENMDRLHWLHKSNDATVGLQWHYTYHPSDLTNIESSHNSYYPHHNVNTMSQQTEDAAQQQQQSRPFDFSQQETQDKQTFDQDAHVFQTSQAQRNEHDQQSGSFQQTETSHFDGQFNQNSEQIPLGVIPLQNLQQTSTQTTEQTEHKIESRILEAYGGGPYDASRNDDIYRRVRPNPSATLPPIFDEDPWDIREKPREMIPWTVNTLPVASTPNITATSTTETTEITTQIIEATTMEAPSFWNRLGHKITRTYDKAKEKAKEYFG